ncbi:TolC family protein [Puia dinghuensis]|uniref:Transporter n=1 Tax=Puia dinghuensis TaxID=1792502 RepID=A0A8J2XPM6_9BACT|nr:TolC family protein [Puia dinghuensis]GGA88515.1 transporter [Puia dinghuensis]
MKKASLLFLLGWAAAFHSIAQRPYTLQECIDTALQKSLQLKSDNYDLAKTQAGIGEAYSSLLPSVNASGSYQYYFKLQKQLIPANVFGGPAGKYEAASLSTPQSKSLGVQLNQTLFNASSLIALKAAKVAVGLDELQIRGSKEDLVYNVSATYYNIQSILKQQALARQNLANDEVLLTVTSDQLRAGLATQTDVDRLTVQRDNTKATLQNTVNSLEKQYNLLKLLMNVPLESDMVVVQDDYDEEVAAPGRQKTDVDLTQKTNYRLILENKKVADLQRRNIKAGYLPSLSLNANYGIAGYNSNADPFKNLNNTWYPSSYVSLSLSIPIFDGFRKKYQIRQQEITIRKYDVQAEQTLQQNRKDVADAYADLESNYITLQSQKRNLSLAQKVLTDIDTQYKSGLVKLTDAINSQSELETAQNNYITALINIKQAELNLKKANGTLINN